MAKPLSEHLEAVCEIIRRSPHAFLFSDFDGTLTAIHRDPALCQLDAETRNVLQQLATNRTVSLAIVSGRELNDLRTRIAVDGIVYVGNHGLEMSGPDFEFHEPVATAREPELTCVVEEVSRWLRDVPGAWVENKRLTASIHYREVAPPLVPGLREIVRLSVASSRDPQHWRVRAGKKVLEILPAVDWHKGSAVAWLAERRHSEFLSLPEKPVLIYLGDDETDEDAFAVCRGGITIRVGEDEDTQAQYRANDPAEVCDFLSRMIVQA